MIVLHLPGCISRHPFLSRLMRYVEENGHVMSALEIEEESEWISSSPPEEEEEEILPLGTAAPPPTSSLLSEMDIVDNLLAEADNLLINVDVVNDILAEAGSLLDEVDDCFTISNRPEGKLVVPLEESSSNVVESQQVK